MKRVFSFLILILFGLSANSLLLSDTINIVNKTTSEGKWRVTLYLKGNDRAVIDVKLGQNEGLTCSIAGSSEISEIKATNSSVRTIGVTLGNRKISVPIILSYRSGDLVKSSDGKFYGITKVPGSNVNFEIVEEDTN